MDRTPSSPDVRVGTPGREGAFWLLFETHPSPMWLVDAGTRAFLALNPAGQRLYGYSEAAFLQLSLQDLVLPGVDADQAHPQPWPAAFELGGHQRHCHKDQSLLEVETAIHDLDYEGRKALLVRVQPVLARPLSDPGRRTSDLDFLSMWEHMALGMYRTTPDGQILLANPALVRMLGYESFEALAQRSLELEGYQPDYPRHRFREMIEGKGEVKGLESIWRRKDGSQIFIRETAHVVLDEAGLPLYYEGTVEDITEQKLTTLELARQKDLLAAVMQGTTEAVFAKRADGRYAFINQAGAQMLGLLPADVIGRSDLELLPLAAAAEFWRTDDIVLSTGRPFQREETAVVEGKARYFLAHKAPWRDETGQVIGIIGITNDITELKRAHDQLQRMTERLRLLHRLDLSILMGQESTATIIRTALAALQDSLHSSHASLLQSRPGPDAIPAAGEVLEESAVQVGRPLTGAFSGHFDLLTPPLTERVEETSPSSPATLLSQALQASGLQAFIKVPLLSERGVIGVLLIGWEAPRPLPDEDVDMVVEVSGQLALLIEHTRLRQEAERTTLELEQRVGLRTAQLQAANAELEAFSYSVSHDLRSPLRAMDGFSKALLDSHRDRLDPEGHHFLERIQAAAQRMGGLIDDLLNLSRISRSTMAIQPVNLTRLAQTIVTELTSAHLHRRVEVDVAPTLLVQGDPRLLRIALQNLLENAWKFTGSRPVGRIEVGQLTLTAFQARHEDWAQRLSPQERSDPNTRILFVRDNGVGFDMDHAGKILAPFQRLHSMQEFPGTGIGLTIVDRIVARHGGRLWFDAQVGVGATFYFTLGSVA